MAYDVPYGSSNKGEKAKQRQGSTQSTSDARAYQSFTWQSLEQAHELHYISSLHYCSSNHFTVE